MKRKLSETPPPIEPWLSDPLLVGELPTVKTTPTTPVVAIDYKFGGDKSEKEKWKRAPLPQDFSTKTHSVAFQQMDIQYVMERSPETGYDAPVMKMFGCSQEGYSVSLSVHNFLPYIYVPVPEGLVGNLSQEELCNNFRYALDSYLRDKAGAKSDYVEHYVLSVEVENKMDIMFYREEKSGFFKITFSSPRFVTQARTALQDGSIPVTGIGAVIYKTYESDILFVSRYMIDNDIGGASWIELPAGKYKLVTGRDRKCNTTIEAEVSYEDLVAHKVDDVNWSHNAPLRTLSFDIECAGRPGSFPKPEQDPVIQIANYVSVAGQEKPIIQNVFVLGSCTPILGVDVRCYETEEELFREWSQFVVATDPDILTGYNIEKFDLQYLKDRARALGLKGFDYFTREKARPISVKDSTFSSAQTGTRESKEWSIYGRIVFDVYKIVQANHKLSSYKLNSVAQHFLKEQKEDVHHSMITKLHNGKPEDRRRLAVYCLKDAYLPQRLIDKRAYLISYIEMARVTGVPFSFLLSKGQGVKVMSQILRKARKFDLVIPYVKAEGGGDGFEGATVLDPKVGFYDKPIFTLDFASLYPSIMQAHNLCHTTYIPGPAPAGWVKDVDYEVTPCGHKFATKARKEGILTHILKDLLSARRNAKTLMENATDKYLEQVYNCRQLALKISANSVYGFTGQAVGKLPCLQISESVTSYGRQMIELTKKTVEEEFSIANGYAHNAEVIYGDTDSVMVCAGVETVEEAIELGRKGAVLVTKKFPSPIKLEFEKVYYPWLLMSKKKYAGLFWTKPDKPDKLDAKGIESVRRDNCGIVRHVVERVLSDIIAIKPNIPKAIDFCKGVISNILQNKIDLSLLIVTKSFSRPAEAYKSPQAHVVLAQKMEKRDPSTAPSVGDRVPYVIVQGDKRSKMFDKAEDPMYVLENDVPIDSKYYIDQLISPLCRIFGPIIENPEAVFTTGEHTKKKYVPTPKAASGLGKFLVVKESCMGCKTPLNAKEKVLCTYCQDNSIDIYSRYVENNREKEVEFQRLWTHCQQCQGSVHTEVVCAANDCPIFYKRTKAHKECVESQKALSKFALSW